MTDDYPELERLLELFLKISKCHCGCHISEEPQSCSECDSDWNEYQNLKSQIITEHQIVERLRKEIQEQSKMDDFDYKHHSVDDNGKAYLCYDHNDVAQLLQQLLEGKQ